MNLISNAVEAMYGISGSDEGWKRRTTGGEISIKTKVSKEMIVITVSDTVPGISEEDLCRVFDPFYTKKKKMGIGVGLSTCHNIVENHGGTIVVKERTGRRCYLYL